MNRASPVDMRKALEIANIFSKAGILFVPMPVLNDADYAALKDRAAARLEQIERACSGN
jgi:hypothetical protein